MINNLNAKNLIRDTFIELYKNKCISNIRITELTQKAGISRGTFYLYYQDIYDLRREIEDELIKQYKKIMTDNINKGVKHKGILANRYIVDYMVSGNVEIIKKWLNDDNIAESRDIALLISKFTIMGPIGAIK